MPTYKAIVYRSLSQVQTFEVTADDEDSAHDKALQMAEDAETDWKTDNVDEYSVEDLEKTSEDDDDD